MKWRKGIRSGRDGAEGNGQRRMGGGGQRGTSTEED